MNAQVMCTERLAVDMRNWEGIPATLLGVYMCAGG